MGILVHILLYLCCVICYVKSLPCLTNQSKTDFNHAKKALKEIKEKVDKLDADLTDMEKEFSKRKWLKYKKHCYFLGIEKVDWFTAERKCREIGAYLTKIGDKDENSWLAKQVGKSIYQWMGMTDLKEGVYRWTYDQEKVGNFAPWYTGGVNRGTNYNCAFFSHLGKWWDYPCEYKTQYVCESNFCF